ncbi:MAG: hypothetical protein IJ389_00150 [Clostridia bacterium]|nr:hypothetical protein [Clostridia bacterium]
MAKRILAIILSALMLFSLFSCTKNEGDGDDATEVTKEINPLPVLKTENFEVTVSMMTYYFNAYYRSFVKQNEANLTALGLNTTADLKNQKYDDDYTWFDYFCFVLAESVPQQLALAEAAKAAGHELSEDDKAYIESEMEKLNKTAEEAEKPIQYIITLNYGDAVNELTIRKCLELTRYSKSYGDKLASQYSFSDEELDSYFEKNANTFLSFNYIRYQINKCDVEKVNADFSSCVTEEDFVNMIKKYAKEAVYDADDEYMEELLDDCYVYGAAYNDTSDFAKWAFDKARNAYDIYIKNINDDTVLVAMALPGSDEAYKGSPVLWKDITPLHNINSIIFSADEYGNEKDAKKKAEEIFERYKNGESFAALMEECEGGSSSNLVRGNIPTEIEKWVFDEARTEGEVGLVTVKNSSTYLLEMRADGIPAWKHFTLDALRNETFNNEVAELVKNTAMEENSDGFSQITTITMD